MRILTWNINGVRTLPQYHPWNTLKTYDDILHHLEADIICFQEMKSSRSALPKPVALPPSYDAFFSFPIRKSGYSGVATYTRIASVIPAKAEEGLSGVIQLKPSFRTEDQVSFPETYPQSLAREAAESIERPDYSGLDSEGRTLVLDFGLFILINVYCPNDGNGTEERDKYKADFHRLLEARVRGLVEKEGREVIVVGDLNACASVDDHCEGPLMAARGKAEGLLDDGGFFEKEARRWLRDWVADEDGTGGCMIDIVRRLWPVRKGMYTCWNTKISARETNYGTRIDYILITRGLLPWVKAADIQPGVKGSDHCPVYLDLHDEITCPDGTSIKLRNVLGDINATTEPPRLASKFWDEYSGKQKLLESFFDRKGGLHISSDAHLPSPPAQCSSTSTSGLREPADITEDSGSQVLTNTSTPPRDSGGSTPHSTTIIDLASPVTSPLPYLSTEQSSQSQASDAPKSAEFIGDTLASRTMKRKSAAVTPSRMSASKKQKSRDSEPKQTTLSTFFAKPKTTALPSTPLVSSSQKGQKGGPTDTEIVDVDLDADYLLAVLLSQEPSSPRVPVEANIETKQAWTNLLAPIEPPKCTVHGEPAKELTVGKAGPNKGKKFFICARPVGPGYDMGKAERLREHVDHTWRCNFFKWSSDARRDMKKIDTRCG